MWNTKKELIDMCYHLLWEDESSNVFDKNGKVIPRMNSVIDDICRCKVTNLITNTDIRGWLLDFLYNEKTLNVPESKKLIGDIDEDSTDIILSDTVGMPESWYVEINWNIIWYSGITENSLLDVSWINGIHHWGNSVVNFVYLFPEDLIKVSDFFDIDRQNDLEAVDFRDRDSIRTHKRCFAIKPYKGNRKCAIFYNFSWPVLISFSKKLEVMELDDDECGFPDDYWMKIIPYITIWSLLIDTSESEKGQELLMIWYSALENMYQFYATPVKKFRKKIGVRPMRF